MDGVCSFPQIKSPITMVKTYRAPDERGKSPLTEDKGTMRPIEDQDTWIRRTEINTTISTWTLRARNINRKKMAHSLGR